MGQASTIPACSLSSMTRDFEIEELGAPQRNAGLGPRARLIRIEVQQIGVDCLFGLWFEVLWP